jgi:hypothetical protein
LPRPTVITCALILLSWVLLACSPVSGADQPEPCQFGFKKSFATLVVDADPGYRLDCSKVESWLVQLDETPYRGGRAQPTDQVICHYLGTPRSTFTVRDEAGWGPLGNGAQLCFKIRRSIQATEAHS